MKFIIVSILAWVSTKIIYNYTALGVFLSNIPIRQLYVKTVLCFLIIILYLLVIKLIKKNKERLS